MTNTEVRPGRVKVELINGALVITVPQRQSTCAKCGKSETPTVHPDVLRDGLDQQYSIQSLMHERPAKWKMVKDPDNNYYTDICADCAMPIIEAERMGREMCDEIERNLTQAIADARRASSVKK